MKIPNKTLRNGFTMPVYGLGTWQMGGRETRDPSNDDQADITAICTAIEHGVTHIDTAELYAAGHTEVLLGRAMRGYDRSSLFLVSKVFGDHLRYDDLIAACQRSLERLQTDYLDLYLCHRYNATIPLSETMKAMEWLVDHKLIRNIGVSNFTAEHLQEAQAVCNYPVVVNQVHLNLKYREPERKGVLNYCQEHDVMLIAWRPVQKGMLTQADIPIMKQLSQKYGKTPAQIAINWLISQENVVTLSKTMTVEHLEENLGALGWTMEPEDIEFLRHEFPYQEDISDAVPLE